MRPPGAARFLQQHEGSCRDFKRPGWTHFASFTQSTFVLYYVLLQVFTSRTPSGICSRCEMLSVTAEKLPMSNSTDSLLATIGGSLHYHPAMSVHTCRFKVFALAAQIKEGKYCHIQRYLENACMGRV